MNNKQIIDHLVKTNNLQFNLLKAVEECQELALILTQKLTKEIKVDDQAIIDEIGDVKIRLRILSEIFNKDKIRERVNYKLSKFKDYIDNKSYKNI